MSKALTIGRQVDAGIYCEEVVDFAFAAVLGRELSDRELYTLRLCLVGRDLLLAFHGSSACL